jgi:arylsulfatase A-like enzyme
MYFDAFRMDGQSSRMPFGSGRPSPPNILLIIADDHRADAIGALGHPVVSTPGLDRLVRRGTAFTNVRIAGGLMPAVCSPSRACLLTGRLPFQADAAPAIVRDPPYEISLPAAARTLPELFRSEGYATFFTGKWHNDEASLLRSFADGRNIFHGGMCDHTQVPVRDLGEIRRGAPARIGTGFSTDIFCATLTDFIRAHDAARPFFACLALTSPHDPRTPPPSYRALYENIPLPLPANFQAAHAFDNGELEVRDELILPRPLSHQAMRETLADYYGMISHHDARLGRVFSALGDTGQMENTIIAYLSDHGLAIGSHGLLGKQNLYDHSVRVPLILCGPGIPARKRHHGLAHAFDLYATLCDLAGLPVPAGIDSRSLRPMLTDPQAPGRAATGAAYMDSQRMLTDGRWKLIVYQVAGRERNQLFDLANDPGECHDLAADPALRPRLAGLRARLAEWQQAAGDRWMNLSAPS